MPQPTLRERIQTAAKPLSLPELMGTLQNLRGSTVVSFTARVDPKPLKKHRITKEPFPYPGITKVSRVNGIINFHYANSVNNQRAREGNEEHFEALPRAWGVRVYDGPRLTPLVIHKGETYLEVKVERVFDTQYQWQGRVIDSQELEHYLPVKKGNERQELEKEVILRDYNVANIEQITLGGQVYTVS